MIAESVCTGIGSRIILITLFYNRSTALLPQIASLSKLCKLARRSKTISLSQTGMGGRSTNSKPPGSIIMIGQSDTGISSRIILITRFSSRCTALLRLLPALANSANIAKAKLFSPAKLPGFNFLHPIAGYSLILLLPFKAPPCKPLLANGKSFT